MMTEDKNWLAALRARPGLRGHGQHGAPAAALIARVRGPLLTLAGTRVNPLPNPGVIESQASEARDGGAVCS